MKRSLISCILLAVMVPTYFVLGQTELTKSERGKAIEHLKTSQQTLLKAVKGLNEAQLNYKGSAESWSIAQCVEHIAISENSLFSLVNQTLEANADPSRRSEVKLTDEQVVGIITDRSQKIKTRTDLEPTNRFGSYDGSLNQFKTKRKETMKFVKSSDQNLRNHYFEFPFGLVDSYQVIMFMSGHSVRHTLQIKEIMEQASFPKS